MFGRLRETSPARVALFALGALALLVLSWVVAGAFVGDAGRSVVPDRPAVARSAVAQAPVTEDGSDTPAPEVDNSNVDSYAAYQSKDPFRQLIAPKSAGTTGGATTGAGTTTGSGTSTSSTSSGAVTAPGTGDTDTSSDASGPTGASGSGESVAGTTSADNAVNGFGIAPGSGQSGGEAGVGSGPLVGESVSITRRDQRDRPLAAVVRDAGADYAVSDGATITVRDTGGNQATVTDGRGAEITAESGAVLIRQSPTADVPVRALDRLAGPLTVVGSTGITREGADQSTDGGAAGNQYGGGTGSGGDNGLFDSGGDLSVLPGTHR